MNNCLTNYIQHQHQLYSYSPTLSFNRCFMGDICILPLKLLGSLRVMVRCWLCMWHHRGHDWTAALCSLPAVLALSNPSGVSGKTWNAQHTFESCIWQSINLLTSCSSQGSLIFYLVDYKPLKFNHWYVYPDWAYALGLTMALSSILLVPVWGIGKICVGTDNLKQVGGFVYWHFIYILNFLKGF